MGIMHFVLAFILSGVAGIVMGLFGGGIGLILIPILIWLLQGVVPTNMLMHVAIGTAVASIVVIGSVAAFKHHQNKSVDWRVVKWIVSSIVLGVIIGAVVARSLPSTILMLIFGIIVILLSFYVWLNASKVSVNHDSQDHFIPWITISGIFIGFIASVIGANPFCVPVLKKLDYDIQIAIGTTTVIGTFMALAITLMYIVVGWGAAGLPRYATGYVDWAFFVPIAIASSLFVPIGVKLSTIFPKKILNILYGFLLLIIGVKMIITSALL